MSTENQISKLTKMLRLWLSKNELDHDLKIYTIEQWHNRKEKYLNDSEMVITTEGALNFIINYNPDDRLHEEFIELLESFGFYYELGHSWNLGIYKIDEVKRENDKLTYSEKLKDIRWIQKREIIKKRANNKCEDCGLGNGSLEIHHCYYQYGCEPWEYPSDSLRCLCRKCHQDRDLIEKTQRGLLAQLSQTEIESLNRLLTTGLYWYPQKDLFEFIRMIGADEILMKNKFVSLIEKKRINHD